MEFSRNTCPQSFCSGKDYYRLLKEIGYDSVDYDGLWHSAEDEAALLAGGSRLEDYFSARGEEIRNAGLEVSQVHGVVMAECARQNEEDRRHKLLLLHRCIPAVRAMGSDVLVIHPLLYSWRMDDPEPEKRINETVRICAEMTEEAELHGIRLALENMPGKRGTIWSMEQLQQVACFVKSDSFGFCLDTGHAATNGILPAEAVRMLGRKLFCVHIHSCGRDGSDAHLLPTVGKTDFTGFAAALKAVGFSNAFNSEAVFEERFNADGFEVAARTHLAALKQLVSV